MEVDIENNSTMDKNPMLWFEFLVDPSLLIPHLSKPKPEPSPTELIIKLLTCYQNNNNIESQEFTLRGIGLKILALKIAAYLKWDVKIFQSKLPLPIQIKLLEDLVYITTGKVTRMAKQLLTVNIESVPNEVLFAATLWHRWIVSGLVYRGIQQKNARLQNIQLPFDNTIGNTQISEEFNRFIDNLVTDSIKFLHDLLNNGRVPQVLSVDTFVALTDTNSEVKQNWDATVKISIDEFHSQIHYDLATFYFYQKVWQQSKVHFIKCLEFYQNQELQKESFLNFKYLGELKGYLIAIGESFNGYQPSLLYKFYLSVRNGFAGTVNIMQIDNVERSLPLIHRQLTEIETMGALYCEKYYVAKDILIQFATLNLVRDIVEGNTICPTKVITLLKNHGNKAFDLLLAAVIAVIDQVNETECKHLKHFFIHMALYMNKNFKILYESPKLSRIFTDNDKTQLNNLLDPAPTSVPCFETNLNLNISKEYCNVFFEQKLLQRNIIQCYDFKKLQSLVVEWHKKTQGKSLLRINPKWQLPIPLQSVVMSLEDPMLQSIAYLILAKGRELMLAKDYKNSLRMYSQFDTKSIKNSTNPATLKLWKLVSWEILLVKVIQYTEEWPANYLSKDDKRDLISKCEECLLSQPTDYVSNVIPRTELIEHFSLFLLNVGEWEFIVNLEKRWNYFELTTTVAHACQDLIKYKGTKKLNKDVWELVLPVFGPSSQNQQQKRGNPNSHHRDSPNAKNKLNLLGFIGSLRNEHALSLMIALLARLYNILKDESSLELVVEHLSLWPAVVSNANSYNSKSVSEILWETLEIALQHYPNNASWLKLMGDMNFCNEYPEAALKCYIKSLIVATEYFTQSVQKSLFDDHTVKRMIKCCIEVNCYTQAVVLCQFLEQVDYTTAFQCLSEMKPGNCQDAMDAYYSCIWDTTLLEYLIYLHHKRGEEHRKREAIKIIGQLELNSNNSDEIKREASEIRKRKFMRAMAKQYVIKYPI
ncbi:integrator complex subunit 8 [Chrysoperla carnea]|uniref:integrator complex subunit 8 n=1 Tax=Chrysoperla carnea TaxID=189513 RepID=UPI001D093E49|nr:integrator complex subunit 8 [Chrysoperla carnea]